MNAFISLLQALLFTVSSFAVPDSKFKFRVDRAAIDLSATSDVSFAPIKAADMSVKESEKENCRKWYESNVLSTENPAYNFRYGLKTFRRNLGEWDFSVGKESETGAVYRGGKTTYITLTNRKNGLAATVEATIYEEKATCEWCVSLKNTAAEKSAVIKDFHTADCVVPTGFSEVYLSKGSEPAAEDFELLRSDIGFTAMRFTANGGRTESFMPYFNIGGKENGVVFAVGWSGQWYASLRQTLKGVEIKAKQEKLNGYLEPGEEIRSPLVSLSFYDGNNAVKGFNAIRKWTIDCVYPDGTGLLTTAGLGNEHSSITGAMMVENIKNTSSEITDRIDAYWIDAGWYEIINNNWMDSVGTWKADPVRYPDGLAPIAEAAAEKGVGLLAWYEPERCSKGTEVYNECKKHERWMVEGDEERNMVNLGNEETLAYITGNILSSLREYNVSVLRIDCIPALYPYWENGDKMWSDGRKGFVENHYVTNFYKFLDTVLEELPGLKIDNCCSGGKRLDIEMSRRSIPLWRTDYNCADGEGNVKADILEATQCFTYGLSCWLPYTGATAYVDGEYADRTNIMPCAQKNGYEDVRQYMDGNYYPLTYGGLDLAEYLAMQFDKNGTEGTALIYKRENVTDSTYTLKLNGLDPSKIYGVYDYDNPARVYTANGAELMSDGIDLTIAETPKCVIMMYKAK